MMENTDAPSPSKPNCLCPARRAALLLVVLFIAAASFGYWWLELKTYHLAEVRPGVLYRDGNQGLREFANAVAKVKPRTVISLIDDTELADSRKNQFFDETVFLQQKRIKLERIPVTLGGWPKKEDVERFIAITQDPANQPVLVHCAQGVRRTGMMVAAYQQAVLGWDDEKVEREALTFGHSQRTLNDIKTFIRAYDPKTGRVAEGLASGQE